MNYDAWIEINLNNLRHNINLIRNYVGEKTDIMPIIKADAYGHGFEKVCEVLIEEGINDFACARLREAIAFKEKFPSKNILILGECPIDSESELIKYGIEQSVDSYENACKLDMEAKKCGKISKIHIKIDTGMSRFGFLTNEEDLSDMIKIFDLKNTHISGIFTHFTSSADHDREISCEKQMEIFNIALDYIKKNGYDLPKLHVANSGATLLHNNKYKFDMVRTGIITYGLKPSDAIELSNFDLRQVMSLKARIVRIKEFEAGSTVGYSKTYKLNKPERIATLPVGYADGLKADTDNSFSVYLNGERHFLAGRICMDAMMIRINKDCPAKKGDVVTIFGEAQDSFISLDELAGSMGLINYELVCACKLRLSRVYVW